MALNEKYETISGGKKYDNPLTIPTNWSNTLKQFVDNKRIV